MQASQSVVSESSEMVDMHRRKASIVFGQIIHRVAVRIGSKTKLGMEAGLAKEDAKSVIKSITDGNAHLHDQAILDSLISAVVGRVHSADLTQLRRLAKTLSRES